MAIIGRNEEEKRKQFNTITTNQSPTGSQMQTGQLSNFIGPQRPFDEDNPNNNNDNNNETPVSEQTLSQLYGGIRSGFETATSTSIDAARENARLQQEALNRQLEQQRADYLRNRQTLQKETFLRGRNLLSNLANRGLATSGLQQLGDIQRTIATGQQMNDLTQAFERARQGLTSQQQQVAAGLQQFEAGQQAQLQQQLAGLNLQERQTGIQDKERSIAYAESLATLLRDPEISQEVKDALTPLYEQLIGEIPELEGSEGQSLSDLIGTSSGLGQTTTQLANDILDNIGGEGNMFGGQDISALEKNEFRSYVNKSENLAQDSDLRTAIRNNVREGDIVEVNLSNPNPAKAGLNDDYGIVINGKEYIVRGKELAVLIMSGEIQVEPRIAVSILQWASGKITSQLYTMGNQDDAFVSLMRSWLQKNNYLVGSSNIFDTGLKVNTDIIKNPIR